MSNDTPQVNQISVNVARRLDDAVAGGDNGAKAIADGAIWTGALRNQYVNNALRAIANELFNRFGTQWVALYGHGFKGNQSLTFSASGTAVNGDFMYPIKLMDATSEFAFRESLAQLQEDLDPFVDKVYVIEGNLIYGYTRIAGVLTILDTPSTGTFFYIKADRKDTTTGTDVDPNTAPDTTVGQQFFEAVEFYACGLAWYDKGVSDNDQEMQAKGLSYQALAMSKLPQSPK